MFGFFLNLLSKVFVDSFVLSYKSKIFVIYCDLKKNWYIFFYLIKYIFEVMDRFFSLFRKNFIEL